MENDPNAAAADAVRRAAGNVDDAEDAERMLDSAEAAVGDLRDEEVSDVAGRNARRRIEESPSPDPARTLVDAAVATRIDDGIADSAAESLADPAARPRTERGRDLLRQALLRRLGPLDRADAILYLVINQLPHPPVVDAAFARLSWWMTGGHLWAAVPLLVAARGDGRRAIAIFLRVMPALWVTTAILEYPLKRYIRRRRPFVSVVRAIVVGRKPGSYSWPSGHTAAAFAGATLLAACLPRQAGVFRGVASAVGFSRVYLGAHYPGDVVSGAVLGTALARGVRWLFLLAGARWLRARRRG